LHELVKGALVLKDARKKFIALHRTKLTGGEQPNLLNLIG